jgi:hypothetical protein
VNNSRRFTTSVVKGDPTTKDEPISTMLPPSLPRTTDARAPSLFFFLFLEMYARAQSSLFPKCVSPISIVVAALSSPL